MKNRVKTVLICIRAIFALLICALVGLIISGMVLKDEEINLSSGVGIILIVIFLLNVITFVALFILEIICECREQGIGVLRTLIPRMFLKIAVVFILLFLLNKFIFRSEESIGNILWMAVCLVLVSISMDCWKRIKDKAKS